MVIVLPELSITQIADAAFVCCDFRGGSNSKCSSPELSLPCDEWLHGAVASARRTGASGDGADPHEMRIYHGSTTRNPAATKPSLATAY
jgi:hypothetical protein